MSFDYEEVPRWIDRDAVRRVEFTGFRAKFPPLHHKGAVFVKFLNSMVVGIGYVNVTIAIGGNALGVIKLARCSAFVAPFCDGFTARSEFLDSIVVGVRHINKT